MKEIFREYDIRGIFEKELSPEVVKLIGYFLGKKIKKIGNIVSIGYDARTHSPVLFNHLTSGLNMAKVKVLDMGMVATPINYFSNYQSFDGITTSASIMITGSHNPPEYNGFKITLDKKPFFSDDIYALRDEVLDNIDLVIDDDNSSTKIDVKSLYIDFMIKEFSFLKNLDKNIVIDCGNGVAGVAILDIFNGLNLKYKDLYSIPDGTFPNHHPDPSDEENLIDLKKEMSKIDNVIGFAYDGDADRIAVLTSTNNIKGDILAILFARRMKNPIVIGEVKCSSLMYKEIDKIGKSIMYKTGHSNLKVKILETNASLAAEVSGHIFFNDRYFGYDDALYTTLRVLEMIYNGANLDDEISKLENIYSTNEIKIESTEKEKFKIIERIKIKLNEKNKLPKIESIIDIDGVRINFKNGWGLVRASNTTPVLVTRFEANNESDLLLYQESIINLIKSV